MYETNINQKSYYYLKEKKEVNLDATLKRTISGPAHSQAEIVRKAHLTAPPVFSANSAFCHTSITMQA